MVLDENAAMQPVHADDETRVLIQRGCMPTAIEGPEYRVADRSGTGNREWNGSRRRPAYK
jgi:hypothetical protein